MMSTVPCECGSTDIVHDIASGDEVCRSCGVVQRERCIDERPEWTSHAGDNPSEDRSRVGGAVNPHLSNGGLQTVIQGTGKFSIIHRESSGQTETDRQIIRTQRDIEEVAAELGVEGRVVDRATHHIGEALNRKDRTSSQRISSRALAAAALYVSVRFDRLMGARKRGDFIKAAGVKSRDFQKMFRFINETLNAELKGIVHAGKYVPQFAPAVGLPLSMEEAAMYVAEQAYNTDAASRSPVTIAAAAILFVAQLCKSEQFRTTITPSALHSATDTSTSAITAGFHDLLRGYKSVMPQEFDTRSDVDQYVLKQLGMSDK